MPRYTPAPEELTEARTCVCGREIIGDGDTYSDRCQHDTDSVVEDWEWYRGDETDSTLEIEDWE